MIEQQAKVVACDEQTVLLEAERESTCDGCKLKQGCGTGLLDKHVGQRFSTITVAKTHNVEVGQEVHLGIPEQRLLQGALLMYIVPLLFLFVAAGLAKFFSVNQEIEIIAGISGLLVGFYWIRNILKNKNNAFQAKIIKE